MAQTDGEALFRKLSGKDDADGLRLLQEHFPKTAEALRQAHVDQLLTKAKVGDALMPGRIMTGLDKLSPQLRSFVVPAETAGRVDAIGQMLEKLKDPHYNYSGTGRSIDKLFQHVPGAAVGIVSMLLGHNPAIGFALGALTKYISKDAPDAVRLGLLKWLGSNKPIEAGAFKSMVDFIHHTVKGDDLMSRATKAVIKGTSKVIPEHLFPKEHELRALDKRIQHLQTNPAALEHVATHTGYYMPDHGIAITSTAANAAGYLNSIRPSAVKHSPLDPEVEPSGAEKARFDRALTIAEQPLVITHHLSEGTLTSEDVTHLKNLYPGFYARLNQKMTEAIVAHTSKGETVPYDLRFGLSTLLGQPMDSSLIPQNIMNNQAAFAQAEQESQAAQGGKSSSSQVGARGLKIANRHSLSHSEDNV